MAQQWAGQIWRTVKQHKWKSMVLGSVVAGVSWWIVDGKQRVTSALTSYLLKKTLKLDNLQEMLKEGADGEGSPLDGAGFLGQAKNLFGSAFDQPNFSVEYYSSNQSVADNTLVSFLPILQRKIKAECQVEELLTKIRLASSKKHKKIVENIENNNNIQNTTPLDNATTTVGIDLPNGERSSSTESSNPENTPTSAENTQQSNENTAIPSTADNVQAQLNSSSTPSEAETNGEVKTEVSPEQAKNNEEEKMRLWEDLKIASFLQLVVSLYSPVLICLLLRVQVNLVARYVMAEQEASRAESVERRGLTQRTGVNVDTPLHTPLLPPGAQSRYVAVGQCALTHGLTQLIDKLRPHVTHAVKDIPLTRAMTVEHVTGLLLDIQRSVEQECWIGALVGVLLPREDESVVMTDEDEDLDENQAYRLLINETRDIIESRPFSDLTLKLLTQSLTLLSEDLLLYFDQARVDQLAVAKLVPVITKQSAVLLALEQHQRDTVVQSLSFSKDLNDYCFFLFKGPHAAQHPLGNKSPLPHHM